MRNDHPEGHGVKACLETSYPDGQCWFPEGDHMRAALLENGMKAEGHGTKVGWRPYPERAACPDSGRWQRRSLHFEGYHETQGTSVVVECGKGADSPGGQGTRAVYIEGQSI